MKQSDSGDLANSRYAEMHWRELTRVMLASPFEGAPSIFLLVALQYYHAPSSAKALIAASSALGLVLAPLTLTIFSALRVPVARAISILYALSGVALIVVAYSESLTFFMTAGAFALMLPTCIPPLVTAMWQQNAPGNARGTLFSRIYLIGVAGKIGVSAAISWWLGTDIEGFRLVILFYALLLLVAAVSVRGVRSEPPRHVSRNPLARLNLLWRDKLFGYLIAIWFFFGFANWMSLPLRTEYIASGKEFAAYTPMLVVIIIEVIPTTVRFFSMLVWGKLFDRMNFMTLRLILNTFFGLSIFFFFVPSFYMQIVSAVFLGIGVGGGTIVWNLWVTKFAPAEQTADYMAVHTFFTGLRGLTGPFLGYYLLEFGSFRDISMLAVGVILFSILMILPIMRLGDRNTK